MLGSSTVGDVNDVVFDFSWFFWRWNDWDCWLSIDLGASISIHCQRVVGVDPGILSNRYRDRVSAPMKVLLSPISRPKRESLTGQTRQTRQEEETTRFQDTEQSTTVLGFYTVSLGAYPWIQTAEARPSISLALQVRDAEPRLSRTSLVLQERSTMPRRRGFIGTSSLSSSVRFPSVSMPYTSL